MDRRKTLLWAAAGAFAAMPATAMSVSLRPSVAPPAPVGSAVFWDATLYDAQPGTVWYRYRVRTPDGLSFRTVRDYSPRTGFQWVPAQQEGMYEIELTVRNRDTGETVLSTASYLVTSRVTSGFPVLTPTDNELVWLYSAPPCPSGSRIRIRFEAPDGFRQFTPLMNCADGKSVNIYLAGLRAETEYTIRQIISSDQNVIEGPVINLTTGPLRLTPAVTKVLQKPAGAITQGVLLQSKVFEYNVATDIDGNVIWYCTSEIRYLTRPEFGGYFFALIENDQGEDADQLLRQIDLAGNVVFETNAARINEQLDDLGKHHITSFHHEARRLPDGKIMVLAGTERILTDVQGPGDVDVIGDMILVLDRNLQVVWAWDAFDHMDVRRKALLDEYCVVGGGGCPIFRLAEKANDWLHGNAAQLTPDGNILYSARHQDWVLKIDYNNGQGSGDVIWRLGKDGDFHMLSGGEWPWFSHQHDPNFERTGSGDKIVLFDNGNTRYAQNENAHSRGQVIEIDQAQRSAALVLNVDLGAYSLALGSAQKLTNGNYHFDLGWMPNGYSQALEVDAYGTVVGQLETETQQYRSFRMRDLYTPQ